MCLIVALGVSCIVFHLGRRAGFNQYEEKVEKDEANKAVKET